MREPHRLLVIANETVEGTPLHDAIRERPLAHAHHLVAGLERGDGRADCLDRTGGVPASNADLGPQDPEHEAREVRVRA